MSSAWQEIARFGKKLVISGLTSSRFGNISLLEGDKIIITCTGSMLDELEERLVVEVDLSRPCDQDKIASSETCVHRAVYQSTINKARAETTSTPILLTLWLYLYWREGQQSHWIARA
jgi:L-fuculose-phosphate aldolase